MPSGPEAWTCSSPSTEQPRPLGHRARAGQSKAPSSQAVVEALSAHRLWRDSLAAPQGGGTLGFSLTQGSHFSQGGHGTPGCWVMPSTEPQRGRGLAAAGAAAPASVSPRGGAWPHQLGDALHHLCGAGLMAGAHAEPSALPYRLIHFLLTTPG